MVTVYPEVEKEGNAVVPKPAPITVFKALVTNGMSDGNVIFSLQPASMGSPTLTRKSRDERAPTVVSAPAVLSTVTKLN